jgi:hypothetical protein
MTGYFFRCNDHLAGEHLRWQVRNTDAGLIAPLATTAH